MDFVPFAANVREDVVGAEAVGLANEEEAADAGRSGRSQASRFCNQVKEERLRDTRL